MGQEAAHDMQMRCPHCRISWFLFPPAKVHGTDIVRCIECKTTYPAPASRHAATSLSPTQEQPNDP
jgi:hypothetical protein